eukprot:gnl/Spiro4/2942_TR1441_c0_g1_i1.p1 gnl/Spiro4/2942_TR1441_c0_g1~~gnl/Spiro4/2942_TR1441_c0_g1_i1.p1  ORF type:complete len:1069 (-),score=278.25 gnl/Spiro4/2942_TR1441_c0_g1_i1:18-3224(-)
MLRLALSRATHGALGLFHSALLPLSRGRRLCSLSGSADTSALPALRFAVDDVIHGFRVKQISQLEEFSMVGYILQHDRTGSQVMYLDRQDPENLFSVNFRTIPTSSSGVSHILEHTALCGSQQYPVHDPFTAMRRRSLSTFMNAFTSNEYTMYPFSTLYEKDFDNLLRVYLDAAFFPLLTKDDFRREGHNLELVTPENPRKSKAVITGVVFNEMKGAMADPGDFFQHAVERALFPAPSPYSHNFGGDPAVITTLTHEQLREFHASHYHPSNARFFFYGNQPLAPRLQMLDELVMRRFERSQAVVPVAPVPRFQSPIEVTLPFSGMVDDVQKGVKTAFAWVTNDCANAFDTFAMECLSVLLMDDPASPLYKALLSGEDAIASNYVPCRGYTPSLRDGYMVLGADGIRRDDIPAVQEKILKTLEQVATPGFDQAHIDSVLHSMELSQKHVQNGFGLVAVSYFSGVWCHNDDPLSFAQPTKMFARLKDELAKGPFFQTLVRERLLNNPHRVALHVIPDEAEAERLLREEQQTANKLLSAVPMDARSKLTKPAARSAGDVSCLPSLTVDDIPLRSPNPDPSWELLGEDTSRSDVWCTVQPTNGLVYMDVAASFTDVPPTLLPLMPIFSSLLGSMSTTARSFEELSVCERMLTGGVAAQFASFANPNDVDRPASVLKIRSHFFSRNARDAIRLVAEIFNDTLFSDTTRLRNLLNQAVQAQVSELTDRADTYASILASTHHSVSCGANQAYCGLSSLDFLRALATNSRPDLLEIVAADLASLAKIIREQGAKVLLRAQRTSELAELRAVVRDTIPLAGSHGAAAAPTDVQHSSSWWPAGVPKIPDCAVPRDARLFVQVPVPVNFVAQSFPAPHFTHEDFPALSVLSQALSFDLHEQVREKGGAYGADAMASPRGAFILSSYRDPAVRASLRKYEECCRRAIEQPCTVKTLREAKMQAFANFDVPIVAASAGAAHFFQDLSPSVLHEYRNRLLHVTEKDVDRVAAKYLSRGASVAVLGGEAAIHADKIGSDDAWIVHEMFGDDDNENNDNDGNDGTHNGSADSGIVESNSDGRKH